MILVDFFLSLNIITIIIILLLLLLSFSIVLKEMISVTHQKRTANQPVAEAKAKANPYPNAIILELSLLGSGNR